MCNENKICKVSNSKNPCSYNKGIYSYYNEYHLECLSEENLYKLYYEAWNEFNRLADIYENNQNENTGYEYSSIVQKIREIENELKKRK